MVCNITIVRCPYEQNYTHNKFLARKESFKRRYLSTITFLNITQLRSLPVCISSPDRFPFFALFLYLFIPLLLAFVAAAAHSPPSRSAIAHVTHERVSITRGCGCEAIKARETLPSPQPPPPPSTTTARELRTAIDRPTPRESASRFYPSTPATFSLPPVLTSALDHLSAAPQSPAIDRRIFVREREREREREGETESTDFSRR